MKKKNYKTRFLWDSLIVVGKSNGLTDDEIVERIAQIEENYEHPKIKSNILFQLMKKKGTVKLKDETDFAQKRP